MKISTNCSSLVILGDFFPLLFLHGKQMNSTAGDAGTLLHKQINHKCNPFQRLEIALNCTTSNHISNNWCFFCKVW